VFKNIASQKVAVYARNVVTDQPYTGGAATISAQYSKDGAACGATTDVNPTELDAADAPGIYIFDFADAGDSNADMIVLSAVSTTTNIQIEPLIIYTIIQKPVITPGVAYNAATDTLSAVLVVTRNGVTLNIDTSVSMRLYTAAGVAVWTAVNLAEDANNVWAGTKSPSGMTPGSAYYLHIVVVHSAVTYTVDVPVAAVP